AIDGKIGAANKQLRHLVAATGSSLPELNGIGPSSAARLLGDIDRFATAAHFASWQDIRERRCNPTRRAQSRQPPLRTSHNPDPTPPRIEQSCRDLLT